MAKATSPIRKTRRTRTGARTAEMVFQRKNYILLIAGVLVVLMGYVIMRVDNQVDGFISLYVAPIVILGGYLEIIYAILWRPREKAASSVPPAVQG